MRSPRPLPAFLEMARAECGDDRERLARVLEGLRRYQALPPPPPRVPMPAIARVGSVTLRDYGGTGRPCVFVPSLINPPYVLDLDPERSLRGWLAAQGVRPLLVDWGLGGAGERRLGIAGMIIRRLLPLIRSLPEPPALAGYCLGGTMALAAATLTPIRRVALIATPWRFGGYGDREAAVEHWAHTAPLARALGTYPMELLQPLFWALDRNAAVDKYARLADAPEAALRRFSALEDWANDGPPLSLPAARALYDDLFARDLPGRGRWRVGGEAVDPAALTVPVLNIVSTIDRIAPAATAAQVGERLEVALGHVGMVVGRDGLARVWQPLAAFSRQQ